MSLWTSLSQGLDVLGKTKWSHSLRAMQQKKIEFALWFKNSKLQPVNGQCPPIMETKHPLASCVDRSDGILSVLNKQPNLTCTSYIFVSLKKWKNTITFTKRKLHKDELTFFFSMLSFFRSNQNYPANRGFSLAWLLMFTQSFAWLVCYLVSLLHDSLFQIPR